jgi:hypothetical protein
VDNFDRIRPTTSPEYASVELALEYSSYSYDAVKHLLLSQRTPPQNIIPLDPDLIPGITDRWIADSDLNRYDALLTGGAL